MRLIMVLFLLVIGASAESRIALLIGNGAYSEKILNNPVNDVDLLAKKLKELNFNVTKRKNQTMGEMNALLRNFYKKIDGDTIAIIYFSGHGVHSTLDDKNYLIPIGAFETLINEADLNNKAISDGSLLASTNGAKFSILLLDACRSNDFAKVKGDKGLGQPKSILPNDYVISYATEVGKTAKDGDTNSPYALALAQYLTSSYSIGDIFTQVRAKVSRGSGGRQKPYYDPHFENILYLNQGRGGREGGDDGGNIPSFPTPQMLHIKAGSYTMGSNKGDADEKPRHQVNINYDFEIGKYEVTIKEYKACVADGGCKQPEWLEKGSSYNIHTGSGYYYKK
ncbi:MAG: caspase family protein, partial [Sulfurovaceae bacterium]|nr:caspase family protein [Sulfurovaceae bacterium]